MINDRLDVTSPVEIDKQQLAVSTGLGHGLDRG
jgi:hypothetical protein